MVSIRPLQRLRDEAIAPYKYNYKIEQKIGKKAVEITINSIEEDYQTILKQLNKLARLERLEEKATPKKVYFSNYGGYKLGNWHCPVCNVIAHRGEDYCIACGQRLDWSDDDE